MPFKPQTTAEQLMYAVKRVEGGNSERAWIGTGSSFILESKSKEFKLPVLVTNRHVVANATYFRIAFHIIENDLIAETPVVINLMVNINCGIAYHPDPEVDLAAISLDKAIIDWEKANAGKKIYVVWLDESVFATQEQIHNSDILEQVVMVGCPNGQWDQKHGFPLFRAGVTASHLAIDYNGKPEFVVDAALFSGSSGSPVFFLGRGPYLSNKSNGTITVGERACLLGIVWGGPRISENGIVTIVPIPTNIPQDAGIKVATDVRMNLAYVVKAREISRISEAIFGA
jgi:hypothetical protein